LRFTISGKHIDLPEDVIEHAREKTSKLPRYYDSINHVEVIVGGSKDGSANVEIITRAGHRKVFVVSQTDQDVYRCIDLAVHKLERQLMRIKGKERDNKYKGGVKLK
jgi:ribosomal subunit interface protein